MKSFSIRQFIASIAVAAICIINSTAMAAADFYIKFEGIPGESREEPGAMPAEGYDFDMSSVFKRRSNGLGTGKVSLQDFHLTRRIDKSTPKLMTACAQGQHIPQAILSCRKTGGDGTPYLKVTMSDCIISSFQTGGSSSDEVPMESLSLNFTKISFEFIFQVDGGTTESAVFTYDLKAAKK